MRAPAVGASRAAFCWGRAVRAAAGVAVAWQLACSSLGCGAGLEPRAEAARPTVAGLTFAELLAVPSGEAAGRQWIELVNAGTQVACLDGAVLCVGVPWRQRCHRFVRAPCVAPGDTLLLGDGDAPGRRARAGLPVAYAYGALPLPPDLGELTLTFAGEVVADLRYGTPDGAPAPVGGRSLARQAPPGKTPYWCNVEGPSYDGLDVGSPGEPNPGCTLCREGDVWRPLRAPRPGELTIEAVQADPVGPDRGREWLLLRATAAVGVDLLGVTLEAESPGRRGRRWRLQARGCTPLAAGASRRLAVGSRRFAAPPTPPFWLGPTLFNGATLLQLVAADGGVVDAAWLPTLPHHAGVRRLDAAVP